VTGVSEVSKSSKVGDNPYFYSQTVYLKAAQEGSIYLDNTGIGIVWADWDATGKKVSSTTELKAISKFMALKSVTVGTTEDGWTETEIKAATQYNDDLASAQALLKTLRVGLLVSQTTTTTPATTTRTWHEYQLVKEAISDDNQAYTTLNKEAQADGITKAVSAVNTGKTSATGSSPVVAAITNQKTMTDKTMEDYAIAGSQSAIATATDAADLIAAVSANEEVQVDIYVWMEGCDQDTVAANITTFSGTGVSGLQFGFCLGAVPSGN
jgi:hypothetical protein